jgi:formylglycine-generating enzyme required for sulfatase activity
MESRTPKLIGKRLMNRPLPVILAASFAACLLFEAQGFQDSKAGFTNSIGIKMVLIPAGTFRMGSNLPTDPGELKQSKVLPNGDFDEKPVHDVTISYDFYMAEVEVTSQQFQLFREDYGDAGRFPPYVTGVSWYDAMAFCDWLSSKENKHYRLPTEAEWEYAARAGTATHFSSGSLPPAAETANAWGIKNMHTGAQEWIWDWYGPYIAGPQTDPVGYASGYAKVVRGGGIMGTYKKIANGYWPYYARSANRASIAPQYSGQHPIGFRIVEAPLPKTTPTRVDPPVTQLFVKQSGVPVTAGPDSKKPWFRQRAMLPIPPENADEQTILAAGLDPAIQGHNHSGGLAVAPNGDVIYTSFSAPTSSLEYLQAPSFIQTRLRFGADQWDMPSLLFDFADVNDQSALLWNDNGTLRFFGGGFGLTGIPFRMMTSTDSGATWSPVQFPAMKGPLGGLAPQPITSAFRGPDKTMYMGSDAVAASSLLWASKDNGETWFDTEGRTAGRHTTFLALKDGSILGLGGKNSDIDGYMPQAISKDGGKTWTVSKTPFPALGSNQRPTIVRLQSGRIFVAGDYQNKNGKQPKDYPHHGAYVALSDDEGKTWKFRTLTSALPHEARVLPKREFWNSASHDQGTLGYAIAAQGSNGLIHLIASMTHPSQEFEMNEAWILAGDSPLAPAPAESEGKQTSIEQKFPNGNVQAKWSGTTGASGRFVLSGREAWFYADGSKQYDAAWRGGVKTGRETYWLPDGKIAWMWEHRADGRSVWTQYWPNGKKKHESEWKDGKCVGTATSYKLSGEEEAKYTFQDGFLKK